MRRFLAAVCAIAACMVVLIGSPSVADPLKWSAPLNAYPNQWVPTPEPPNPYNNPYAYGYYPYSGYGYGAQNYYGYGSYGYAGGYQAYPGYQNGGFSGNPYMYYYGQ